MKYLFVLLNDDLGGAEKVCMNYVNYLSSFSENDITVYYLHSSCKGLALPSNSNVKVVYGASNNSIRNVFGLFYWLKKKSKFDISFSTHILTNGILSLFRKLKTLQTSKLISRESTVAGDRFHGVKKVAVDFFYRLYGQQDLIICQTEYMKERLLSDRKYLSKKLCKVIRNPISPVGIKRTNAYNPNDITVLFVGRLIPIKNISKLLDSVSLFQSSIDVNIKLVVLGDGPLLSDLVNTASQYENINVKFEGQVNNPIEYMLQADFGVISSLKEGFPNVLLEMMSCAVPYIISTPCCGGLKLIPNIYITDGFDSKDIFRALEVAYKNRPSQKINYQDELDKRSIEQFSQTIMAHTWE